MLPVVDNYELQFGVILIKDSFETRKNLDTNIIGLFHGKFQNSDIRINFSNDYWSRNFSEVFPKKYIKRNELLQLGRKREDFREKKPMYGNILNNKETLKK